jgi:RNA polymerase sigma-70 factor (ECF subfamily)
MTEAAQDRSSGAPSGCSASVSSSLLERVRAQEPEAWRRLVRLYYPLVRGWCERAGLQSEDAADVAQEVFRALAGNVDRFRRDGGQNSFRGWLWGITRRQLLAYRRRRQGQPAAAGGTDAQRRLAELPEPDDPSDADRPAEHSALLRRALDLLHAGVEERTWQAFWRAAVQGQAPADIAAELGMSVNSVYLAKARLLRRLRDEFGDLLD